MKGEEGSSRWCESGHGSGREQIVEGIVDPGQEVSFHSERNWKTTEGSQQKSDMIRFTNDHSLGVYGGQRETS